MSRHAPVGVAYHIIEWFLFFSCRYTFLATAAHRLWRGSYTLPGDSAESSTEFKMAAKISEMLF